MKKISLTLATAASVAAFSYATPSRADDHKDHHTQSTTSESQTTTTTTPTATTPSTSTTVPAQSQPVQSVTVQQPPAQTGTTTTTSSPYAPSPIGSDTYAESTTERRPNRALLSTGVGMFVISYGASVVAGAVSDRDDDDKLFVPVVGPWLNLADRDAGGNNEDLNKAMLVTSGIVQGAGVLLAIGSLIIPETTSTTERRSTTAKASVKVLPVSFGSGGGVGAVGRF